jgi:hypothetical protein
MGIVNKVIGGHEYHIVDIEVRRSKATLPLDLVQWLGRLPMYKGFTPWFKVGNSLYFARESDHLMFLLRWGKKSEKDS